MRCGDLLIKSTGTEKFTLLKMLGFGLVCFPGVRVSFVGESIHVLLALISASVISINHRT